MIAAYTRNLVLPSCLVVDDREMRLARLTFDPAAENITIVELCSGLRSKLS